MDADNAFEKARDLYERAIFAGDQEALAQARRLLDEVAADLALASGRIMHGEFLLERERDREQAGENPEELPSFERAAALYQALGDQRGEGEALFWIGCCHQVVGRDNGAAVPVLERSLSLATQVGDEATMGEALRHLGIAENAAGRLEHARARLEESTALWRRIGQRAGVAANLVGLTYVAIGQRRRDDALSYLDEAAALADEAGAPLIKHHIDVARARATDADC